MNTKRVPQMKTFLLLLVGLFPLTALAQTQIGDDLIGELENDLFGSSVALSEDGSRMVVGSITNSETFPGSGQVQVFENVDGTWVQLGQDINGTSLDARLGRGVAISDDGSIIALGADGFNGTTGKVRVFEFSSGSWIQIGQDLIGSEGGSLFGNEVALSSDGSIVAVGSPAGFGDLGSASVFENQGGTWVQLGDDIVGDVVDGLFGNGLGISSDGLRVAVGGDGFQGLGRLRAFEFVAGNWTQVGQTIVGEDITDRLGSNVDMSDDGSVIAVSAIGNDFMGPGAGAVRVFRDTGGTWTQIGSDISGNLLDQFGASVGLSGDGNVLVGGSFSAETERIFINENDVWVELATIAGDQPNSFFGLQSNVSKDGLTLAVGAQSFDGNGFNRGLVRVYDLSELIGCPFKLGDLNEDGAIDLLDVGPFVDALAGSGEILCQADINGDGAVDLLDVDPFVALLSGG